MKKDKKMIVCFLAPALICFIFMFLYPIVRTVLMSFFKVEGVSDAVSLWKFVGFDNYLSLFQTKMFWVSMTNMGKIWLFGGVAVLALALLFAVILTSGIRGKSFWRAVIYVPNIISSIAMATMWIQYVFNKRFGLLHTFFNFIGMEKLAKIDYMAGSMKFVSLLIAFSFGSVGYFMLIFISGIEKISTDYFEAATIDGANKIKQFIHITLPLIKGVFKSCVTFWTVSVAGFFAWSQMWAAPLAMDLATVTPAVYMYNITFGNMANIERDAGKGSAVGILMALTVLIVFFVTNRIIKDDDLEY